MSTKKCFICDGTQQICDRCGGQGGAKFTSGPCLACGGTGTQCSCRIGWCPECEERVLVGEVTACCGESRVFRPPWEA